MPVRAITFDFWRTLFREVDTAPRNLRRATALAESTGIPLERAEDVMEEIQRAFLKVHIYEQRTLSAEDAIPMIEEKLELSITPETADHLCACFANAILDHPPVPIDGALDAVRAAAGHVPVGLISDSGISPGSCLLQLLDHHGFRKHFTSFSFSDEVGVAKPQSAMYRHAAQGLNVHHTELMHIGDLEPTDVRGALNVGASAALFGGDNARYVEQSNADYVFTSWTQFIEQLPSIVA